MKYAVIQGDYINTGGNKRRLPTLEGSTINFVLATSVDKIKLELAPGTSITIDETSLDKGLEIDVGKLNVRDGGKWGNVLKNVRQGIKIKFLLTVSE